MCVCVCEEWERERGKESPGHESRLQKVVESLTVKVHQETHGGVLPGNLKRDDAGGQIVICANVILPSTRFRPFRRACLTSLATERTKRRLR